MAENNNDYALNSIKRSPKRSMMNRNFKKTVSLPKIVTGKNISLNAINSREKIRG